MNSTKIKKVFKLSIGFLLNFICVVLIFITGAFSPTTLREEVAYEIADLAGDGIVNIYQKEKEDGYIQKSMLGSLQDIVIKENKSTYSFDMFQSGLTYGVHDGDIKIPSLKIDNNISFLVSGIFSNHLNTNEQVIMDAYYLELMFKSSNTSYAEFNNFCYITKDQADYLIKNNEKYNDYGSLLNETLEVQIDDVSYRWKIANIITPFGEYYDGCIKTFGNFLLCYTNLPALNYISISHFYKNDAKYNFFKIPDTLSKYKDNNFEFVIDCPNNSVNDKIHLYFNGHIQNNLTIFVPLMVLTIIWCFSFLCFLFVSKPNAFMESLEIFVPSFVAYMIFSLLFHVNGIVTWFSFFSTMFLLTLLVLEICMLILKYLRRNRSA